MNKRLGTHLAYSPSHREDVHIFLDEKTLLQPLHWKRPRKIFVCSMTDLFGEWVIDDMIDRIFAVMTLCPQHTFQVLTKRPERMRSYMLTPDRKRIIAARVMCISEALAREAKSYKARIKLDHFSNCFAGSGPPPNVWLGVTAEDQANADARIPFLLTTPAAVHWVSHEPALGPIDYRCLNMGCGGIVYMDALAGESCHPLEGTRKHARLDWIVTGGESGPHARPLHPDWARSDRDQSAGADVAFNFKQWGEHLPWDQFSSAVLVHDHPEQTKFRTSEWDGHG
jgi:protein gp37